jgi:hypothetical protein
MFRLTASGVPFNEKALKAAESRRIGGGGPKQDGDAPATIGSGGSLVCRNDSGIAFYACIADEAGVRKRLAAFYGGSNSPEDIENMEENFRFFERDRAGRERGIDRCTT